MKPRGIILIEGADASGKTTLANHLRKKYDARYLHSIVRKDIWRWHLGALRFALKLAEKHLVILDRHWISEQAYGQIFRGGPAYDLGARFFDKVFSATGAITVLCAPNDIKKQLARHSDLKTKRPEKFDNIEKVARLYLDLRYGNLAHPGTTYLDECVRFGDFIGRPDVLVYDIDIEGRHIELFSRDILRRIRITHDLQRPTSLIEFYKMMYGVVKP